MLQVIFILLIVMKIVVTSNISCPIMCKCSNEEIYCKGLQLENFSFPNDFCPKFFTISETNLTETKTFDYDSCNLQLQHLHIINCGTLKIYPEAFDKFSNLYWLNLNGNSIHSLESEVFKGLSQIEILNIENNDIQNITFGAFIGLQRIITLSLSNNKLTFLENGLFLPLNHLKQLKITNNLLNKIKPEYFIGLLHLNKLYLNGNKIYTLQMNAFVYDCNISCEWEYEKTPLQKLQYLYLQNNFIENIERSAFKGLKHVVYVNLNGNKLNALHSNAFHGLVKLYHLDLENCTLKELNPDTFNGLNQLHKLYMSKNDFYILRSKYFEHLLKLKYLKISRNIYLIEHSIFKSTPNLTDLNLDNNRLKEIPLNVTKDLMKLEVLSLSRNKFQVLENYMFKYLCNLKILILNDNRIYLIHDVAFFGLKNLQKLSLRNNNICTLSNDTPIAYYSEKSYRKPFMKLEKLTYLDLYGNCLQNLGISVFNYLPKLWFLNLGNNRLSEVDESVIMSAKTLKNLVLHGNPLNCSCKLKKIRKWLLQNNINTSVEFGHEPLCATGIEWDKVFQSLSCVIDDKDTRFLNKFGLFMIGPSAIIILGFLSLVYTKLKKKSKRFRT
ncbi:hypothetical protein L9F63_003817 [Diploptera punctata]|uniref:Uncharacterized protein n=1 Tax=Diploptera punctata TaxID=6984 RepID=A0AAD7ZJJ1_DIPPU|nr:hypothetical protein L9F63_003817 [Diploptera punctata]